MFKLPALALLCCLLASAAEPSLSDRRTIASSGTRHFGYPRIVRAPNGELLIFFRAGTTPMADQGAIAVATSRDGKAWSAPRQLDGRPDPDHGWHFPMALATAAGRILLWQSSIQVSPPARRHPVEWRWSDDNGRKWTDPVRFDPTSDRSTAVISDAIDAADGILAVATTFGAAGYGDSYVAIWMSTDGGKTWTLRSTLTKPGTGRGGEGALAELTPGRIVCLLTAGRSRGLARFDSTDSGRSWTEGQNLYGQLGCTLERPVLTRLSTARLLLTGRDIDHRQIVAYLSENNGASFGHRAVVDNYTVDGGYTSCVAVGVDAALMVYYSDSVTGASKTELRAVRVQAR